MLAKALVLFAACASLIRGSEAFSLATPGARHSCRGPRAAVHAGLFDGFQKAAKEREAAKEAQWQAMKDMQAARRDPEAFDKATKRTRYVAMARKAAEAGNLPDGWGCAQDPASEDTYYFNKEKGIASTWDPPLDEMVKILEEQNAL